jgi:hypothetical protein
MSRLPEGSSPQRSASQVDPDGELSAAPALLIYAWVVLGILVALEAAKELFGISGPPSLYEAWFPDTVIAVAGILVLVRAGYEPRARRAWLVIGLALLSWCIANVSWSLVYGTRPRPPYPTFADGLWLLWYPLLAAGIIYLIRLRVHRFVLHRWLDGLAVILLVLAAGVVLVIQPDFHNLSGGALATTIGFSYPVLDVLLIGAILGVVGLLGWRPDRVWLLLGLGILATAIADATFAVQQARGHVPNSRYAFVWALGALLIAYAAWVRAPGPPGEVEHVVGLRAVALPLIANALAIGIQIYAFLRPVNETERLITVVVLVVSSVQIFLTRPRPATVASGHSDTELDASPHPVAAAPGLDGDDEVNLEEAPVDGGCPGPKPVT